MKATIESMAREWVFARKPDDLKTIEDVEEVIAKTYTAGIAYHLDDSAEEIINIGGQPEGQEFELFTDDEAKHMNALRDAMVAICDKAGVDVHTISLKHFARLNPIDSVDAYITANWPIEIPDQCSVTGANCISSKNSNPCTSCATYKRLAEEAKAKGITGTADRLQVMLAHKNIGDTTQSSEVEEVVPESEQHVIDAMRDECVFCGASLVEAHCAVLPARVRTLRAATFGARTTRSRRPIAALSVKELVTVEVRGGCAEVTSCPPNVTVEIIDHDNH